MGELLHKVLARDQQGHRLSKYSFCRAPAPPKGPSQRVGLQYPVGQRDRAISRSQS